MVALETNAYLEIFLVCLPRSSKHLANALPIDGNRLLHEYVLTLFDCLSKMNRPKAWRRRQDDHVSHTNGLLVSFETVDLVFLLHVRFQAVIFFKTIETAIHAVFKGISHGHELDIASGTECLIGGTGTPAAATDQRHLDGVTSLGKRATLDGKAAQCRCTADDR